MNMDYKKGHYMAFLLLKFYYMVEYILYSSYLILMTFKVKEVMKKMTVIKDMIK